MIGWVQASKVHVDSLAVGDAQVPPVQSVKNLGIWIDSNMSVLVWDMFSQLDQQVSTLIQCLCSVNAVKYWARVTFREGLHNVKKKRIHTFQNRTQAAGHFGSRYFWETVAQV